MARNRIQFQKGYSLTQFMLRVRNGGEVPGGAVSLALAERVRLSKMRAHRTLSRSKAVRCISVAAAGTRCR